MRVLVIISVLAAAGLLWASLAAAQHIRNARRRRRYGARRLSVSGESCGDWGVTEAPTGNPAPPKPPGRPASKLEFGPLVQSASTNSIDPGCRTETATGGVKLPHSPFQPRARNLRAHG